MPRQIPVLSTGCIFASGSSVFHLAWVVPVQKSLNILSKLKHVVKFRTNHWQVALNLSNLQEFGELGEHEWSYKLKAPVSPIYHQLFATNHQWGGVSTLLDWPIGRRGARWFENIEQNLKIALKHLKVSIATLTRGPKRRISAFKCTRRCNLSLDVIFDGSIMANRLSTFAMAISMSNWKQSVMKQE